MRFTLLSLLFYIERCFMGKIVKKKFFLECSSPCSNLMVKMKKTYMFIKTETDNGFLFKCKFNGNNEGDEGDIEKNFPCIKSIK